MEWLETRLAPAAPFVPPVGQVLTWAGPQGTDPANFSVKNDWVVGNARNKLPITAYDTLQFTDLSITDATNDISGLRISRLIVAGTYSGEITLNQSLTVDGFWKPSTTFSTIAGGKITGTGDLNIANANVNWTAGTISGSGNLNVQTGSLLTLSASNQVLTLQDRWLFDKGLVQWTDGNFRLQGNATIVNSGVFEAYAGAFTALNGNLSTYTAGTMDHEAGNTRALFTNQAMGFLTFYARVGNTVNFSIPVKNLGKTTIAGGGTASFNDGGTNSAQFLFGTRNGDLQVPSTNTIQFGVASFDGGTTYNNPTFVWAAGATLGYSGVTTGSVLLQGRNAASAWPTISVSTGATFTLPRTADLTVNYAAFTGPGTVTLPAGTVSLLTAVWFMGGVDVEVKAGASVLFRDASTFWTLAKSPPVTMGNPNHPFTIALPSVEQGVDEKGFPG